jgi:hypothetical protein
MKSGERIILASGLILALLAAGGARPQAAGDGLSAPASAQAAAPAPPPAARDLTAGSTCEAASLAWLVGKPRSAIPVPVYPSLRRVSCTTCLVTQDYVPARTDIIFDNATGLITDVKCG